MKSSEVDIANMGPNKFAKFHRSKRAFRDSVLATFLWKKQKHPSSVSALGSAIDVTKLTISRNILKDIANPLPLSPVDLLNSKKYDTFHFQYFCEQK